MFTMECDYGKSVYFSFYVIKILSFPRQSPKRFIFRVKSSDLIFFLLGISHVVKNIYIKSKSFMSLSKNEIITLKSYCPPTPHNIILFEFNFNVKFHLLLKKLLKKYYFMSIKYFTFSLDVLLCYRQLN